MANVSFTRDEVILALDVYYFSVNKKVSKTSSEMEELSALLNRLPIHSASKRVSPFRTPSGIAQQLLTFRTSSGKGEKHPHVGKAFYDIAIEFEDRFEHLHAIADAIRRNEGFYDTEFGSVTEDEGFPEGVLLGHLHKMLEHRLAATMTTDDRCCICKMQPRLYYKTSAELLQLHLIVCPEDLDGNCKYGTDKFITVCPTCHAALHCTRPWYTKDNCEDLLR